MSGVYIHIPYCRTLCPYCDFVKTRTRSHVPGHYVDALCREIADTPLKWPVSSIFFGGGTPSLLTPVGLTRILDTLATHCALDAPEVTLEANPDDVTAELALAWRDAGVNRVSLGVQSFDARVLRYLGRRHDADGALRACGIVAEHFDNWSMDLIFGAHPADAWPATLAQCRALDPPHVSAYGLTYEAGTPFGNRKNEALDDDEALALYRETAAALNGYVHYEISNFAKPGREARHNLVYWRNEEYAGFGCAAYSFLDRVRARNLTDPVPYADAPGTKCETLRLSDAEIRLETVIQHLRLREGLPKASYRERFGREVRDDFGPALDRLATRGLVRETDTHILPTWEGFCLNNEIGLELV